MPRAAIPAFVLALLAAAAGSRAHAEDSTPRYGFSADAAAGFVLAADSLDPRSADSAALWSVQANFLHRIDAPGWGLVVSHNLDLSGQPGSSPTGASLAAGIAPTISVYEAYARLDLADWGQLFVGKRRMGLGIGTIFAPGDLVDPRTGFWDQKNGFRGLGFAASVGPDVAIRAALSLDRSLDAYSAGLKSKAAAGSPAPAAAYAAALDGASGPADPRLLAWAVSADAQLGSLQLAIAGVYAAGDSRAALRPSLGLSYDLGGVILQAEGAAELAKAEGSESFADFVGAVEWYATAGARYAFSGESDSLTLSADYDYNGAPGLLAHTHYILPSVSYARTDSWSLYARALVELEAPSALLSTGLTLYPAQGFDLEITGTFLLGEGGGEFAKAAALPSPGSGTITDAVGLAARVHF